MSSPEFIDYPPVRLSSQEFEVSMAAEIDRINKIILASAGEDLDYDTLHRLTMDALKEGGTHHDEKTFLDELRDL